MSADIAEGSFSMEASLPDEDDRITERTSWSKRPKLSTETLTYPPSQTKAQKNKSQNSILQSLSDVTRDLQLDSGYSSHSSSAMCYLQDCSQTETGLVEGSHTGVIEGSQDMGSLPGTSDGDSGCLQGDLDLDDLLYHFQQFFRHQFDEELQLMHERMCGILASQETHVRRIVHMALSGQIDTQPCVPKTCLGDITGHQTECSVVHIPQPVPNDADSSMITTPHITEKVTHRAHTILASEHRETAVKYNQTISDTNGNQSDSHRDDILTLMSLSCQVSTLLAKPQFRT
ncbi:uncharacterized protein LOC127853068 isoform X2 [Dreissena polymorpha]|uniref:Uncharacterized protein n=1 Tax=Dreissena polymorpha TaxID=45954 RepID=A0A9D4HMX8_DREPO|nr:uncharacterized protein LOC127853068 isoform X2 [Dreissena polymorpha]KAH3724480.1 hypothetical protein DPMN_050298 [Dreissena polymorpha]